MRDLLNLIGWMLIGRFRSKASLEVEILALRHQLNVLRRTSPRRAVLSNFDRMIFVCLYRSHRVFSTPSRSWSRKRLSGGIGQAFAPSGAGNRVGVPAGPASRQKFGD